MNQNCKKGLLPHDCKKFSALGNCEKCESFIKTKDLNLREIILGVLNKTKDVCLYFGGENTAIDESNFENIAKEIQEKFEERIKDFDIISELILQHMFNNTGKYTAHTELVASFGMVDLFEGGEIKDDCSYMNENLIPD